ncbi:MAG TPA: hypothetical protein VGX16_08055 [Solirubrobacteraceae bacterium]|jgi:hypothetical protein|nr:hypothetical protein [Solirubrobacteraceae bacterium]
MSYTAERNGRPHDPESTRGVLQSLPKTRPQRPNARRAAARVPRPERARPVRVSSETASAKHSPPVPDPAPRRAARPARTSRPHGAAKPTPAAQLIPRQGFEAEGTLESGVSIDPPSGLELAGSLAGVLGELTRTGLSGGIRLLRGALSRLPGI